MTSEHDQLLGAFDRETLIAFLHWLTNERGGYAMCEAATGDMGEACWQHDQFSIGYALQDFLLDRDDPAVVTNGLAAVNRYLAPTRFTYP